MYTTLNVADPSLAKSQRGIRVTSLDGLRGLAILAVISFHYVNNQLLHSDIPLAKVLCFVTSFGWVGVDLFFVLSGYLIGNIVIVNRGAGNFFKVFYLRRFFRIVPIYYLLLACVFVINCLPAFNGNYFLTGNMLIPDWSYVILAQNLFMAAQANLGNSALSVTWSICIEEQFYLLFPLFIYYFDPRITARVLLVIIISASLFRMQFDHWIPSYVLLPARMDAIAFGLLVAYAKNSFDLVQYVRRYTFLIVAAMILLVVIMGSSYFIYSDLGPIKHSLFAFVFSLLLLMALGDSKSPLNRFLSNRYLVWIGSLSYSLYLFHYLILGVVHHLSGNTDGIGIYNTLDFLISVFALFISFLFAWITYVGLEHPFVVYGRRIAYLKA